mmetsp:Transcript_5213/g.18968  ORF Transcript_5213/g.18968 Transcript_5213/m.18968 type:complete len:217 (-) Transcript_5213:1750-2400(-)
MPNPFSASNKSKCNAGILTACCALVQSVVTKLLNTSMRRVPRASRPLLISSVSAVEVRRVSGVNPFASLWTYQRRRSTTTRSEAYPSANTYEMRVRRIESLLSVDASRCGFLKSKSTSLAKSSGTNLIPASTKSCTMTVIVSGFTFAYKKLAGRTDYLNDLPLCGKSLGVSRRWIRRRRSSACAIRVWVTKLCTTATACTCAEKRTPSKPCHRKWA